MKKGVLHGCLLLSWFCLLFHPVSAMAANSGVSDQIIRQFHVAAIHWDTKITDAAKWLFLCLATISMVWTFGMLALRRADLQEFFAEAVKFILFTGFFWWLLLNGPKFAGDIITGLTNLAGQASGFGTNLSPGVMIDRGWDIYKESSQFTSILHPMVQLACVIMCAVILVICVLIAANMLLLECAGWILAYAGIFFLGFGGSKWTSEIAINYWRKVLEVAASLFTMILIIGVGNTIMLSFWNQLSASGNMNLSSLGMFLVVVVILFFLVEKLPPVVCSILTGASIQGHGVGILGGGHAQSFVTSAALTGMAVSSLSQRGAPKSVDRLQQLYGRYETTRPQGNMGGTSASGVDSSGQGPLHQQMLRMYEMSAAAPIKGAGGKKDGSDANSIGPAKKKS